MKSAAFDYARPASVDDAVRLLQQSAGAARILAGGQSLGPMLNLRFVQPELIVDLGAIPGLRTATESEAGIELGAGVTHAMIEDGAVPDVTRGFMRRVAAAIGYRAIRNRGTIGGSLCHADPAADWVTALLLLSARVSIAGPHGVRTLPVNEFVIGSYTTALAADEILVGIRIPRLAPTARWAYHKICRKPGEFAEAIVAALANEAGDCARMVLGGLDGAPHVEDDAEVMQGSFDVRTAQASLQTAGVAPDSYRHAVCLAAIRRAALELKEGAA